MPLANSKVATKTYFSMKSSFFFENMPLRSLLARCRACIKTQADNWNWREIDMREGSGVLLFPKLSNTHSICQKAQKRLTAIWTSNIPNSYPFRCFSLVTKCCQNYLFSFRVIPVQLQLLPLIWCKRRILLPLKLWCWWENPAK